MVSLPHRWRRWTLPVLLSLCGAASAQSVPAQSFPSVPAATPAPASSLPSMPVPVPEAAPKIVPQPAVATSPTVQPADAPSPTAHSPAMQTPAMQAPAMQAPAVQAPSGSMPAEGAARSPVTPVTATARTPPAQPAATTPAAATTPTAAPTSAAAPTRAEQRALREQQKAYAQAPDSVSYLPAYDPGEPVDDELGSPYIPVDSTVYPMALRLYSMGYLDTAFIDLRPWTRRALLHSLQASQARIMAEGNEQAVALLASLLGAVADEDPGPGQVRGRVYGLESVSTRLLGIHGLTLRDSYHLGQTIVNDYGRPNAPGFNNVTGFSTVNESGRFSLYVRAEYQHAPVGPGYSLALSQQLSNNDGIPFSGYNLNQATIPTAPVAGQDAFQIQETTLSTHLAGHELSLGRSDAWLSPDVGGAMGWSNNAQDIYAFRINRVEPLSLPYVSRLLGTFRYDFFVGSLKGHTYPNSPYIHAETIALAPTANVRISFQRSVIWGGKGHEPVTLHTFLRSFFSINDTNDAEKTSAQDPGARFSAFNFSWRLPFLTHRVTLYTDSIVHDDVTPISAPRRAAYRPGVYLSQVPGLPKLDFRVEASSTDISTLASVAGSFNYYEVIQRQGYTNKGFILGDWIGREAKGGQAWLTYHLAPDQWVQLEYLNKKTPKDFIPAGTTQNQLKLEVVKRLRPDVQLDAWVQFEGWKAPIYVPGTGLNKDTTVAFQFTWFPKLHSTPRP